MRLEVKEAIQVFFQQYSVIQQQFSGCGVTLVGLTGWFDTACQHRQLAPVILLFNVVDPKKYLGPHGLNGMIQNVSGQKLATLDAGGKLKPKPAIVFESLEKENVGKALKTFFSTQKEQKNELVQSSHLKF